MRLIFKRYKAIFIDISGIVFYIPLVRCYRRGENKIYPISTRTSVASLHGRIVAQVYPIRDSTCLLLQWYPIATVVSGDKYSLPVATADSHEMPSHSFLHIETVQPYLEQEQKTIRSSLRKLRDFVGIILVSMTYTNHYSKMRAVLMIVGYKCSNELLIIIIKFLGFRKFLWID